MIPPYEALRVVVGVDLFLLMVTNALLMYTLDPRHSADGFRTLDTGLLAGDDRSLDEAYAYSAALEAAPPAASAPTYGNGFAAPL